MIARAARVITDAAGCDAMHRAVDLARRLFFGDPRRLAREAQHALWIAGDSDLRRFAGDLRFSGSQHVAFGQIRFRDGARQTVGLSRERLFATHLAISGASGSGKTTLALDLIDQLIREPGARLVALDPKGDLDRGLRDERLPILAHRLGPAFADQVRYLRPFAGGPFPPLRLTARESGTPIEVQSLSLATALAEASGLPLTPPAVQAFTKLAWLAIELNEPLTLIVTWIARPEMFARAARRSEDERLRHYAIVEFAREHRGMLRALQARLESVLLLPSVRAALEAPICISFAQSLEEHHLLIDLSHPPGGEEAAVRILGGPIVGRLTRAMLSRPVQDDSPQVVFAVDELQELLTHYEAASFARLAALARSRRVSLLCANQQQIQLGSKLAEVVRTNAGVEILFRCHAADAEKLAHVLPVSPAAEHPSEERRALVRRMVSLPRRHCLLWVKDGAVPAHFIRARKVDFDALRQAVADVPAGTRDILGRWPETYATRGVPAVGVESAGPARPPSHPPKAEPKSDSCFPSLG